MKVIVLTEHHGTIYIDASTPAQLERACLSILRTRMATPEYQDWLKSVEDEPEKPSLTFEQAQALPEGKVRDMALSEWSEYHRAMESNKSHRREVQMMQDAIDDQNGKLAYKILHKNRNREDEGFEVVDVLEEYPNADAK